MSVGHAAHSAERPVSDGESVDSDLGRGGPVWVLP